MTETDHYDYELPKQLIADAPLAQRADARLLVVHRDTESLSHQHVRDLPQLLNPDDCLVLNDTRVVPARVIGRRSQTHGRWEGLFLSRNTEGHWRLLCKTRGHLRPGELIVLHDHEGRDAARLWILEKLDAGVWLAHCEADEGDWALLERIGHVPLPPYIRGGRETAADRQRYQTVYAREPGSAAAPTAGLHFTVELLEQLALRGVQIAHVTLHVGLDTFRPITSNVLDEHKMHSEWCQLSQASADRINGCRARGGRIVAVGTTSVRVLETAAATGVLRAWNGATELFIRPGHRFNAVDALLTNFHLPRSTLLVLVRTLGGDELMKRAYQEAIREQYRFFSYGDAMLIL